MKIQRGSVLRAIILRSLISRHNQPPVRMFATAGLLVTTLFLSAFRLPGQAFGLYALSEYYLASSRPEALELANRQFDVMEAKSHDKTYGGYQEWFNEDWTPGPPGNTYMGEPDHKLMNTHLHLLEAMTTYYRASKLPLARERLLELIQIQSSTVVRKGLGACTDKYLRNWNRCSRA